MRKLMTLALASAAVAAMACGKDKSPTSTAMSADLKRDIQLASAAQDIRINPDEITPKSNQELALKPKKAPNGPKVIRAQHPTVMASAAPVEQAEVKTEMPQVQVAAAAPAPAESSPSDAPPLARPSPIPMPAYPGAGSAPGNGGNGNGNGGIGGVLGGIFGGVMRGGGIGDDDHCDPRQDPRRGRPVGGDVVYGGGRTLPTGIGGSRTPVRPGGRRR